MAENIRQFSRTEEEGEHPSIGDRAATILLGLPISPLISWLFARSVAGSIVVSALLGIVLYRLAMVPPKWLKTVTRRVEAPSKPLMLALLAVTVLSCGIWLLSGFASNNSSVSANPTRPVIPFEGSAGIANVTKGDTTYGRSVTADPGDEIALQVYGRNRDLHTAVDGLTVKYDIEALSADRYIIRVTFSGGDVGRRQDTVEINSSDGSAIALAAQRKFPIKLRAADAYGRMIDQPISYPIAGSQTVSVPLLLPDEGRDSFSLKSTFLVTHR